MKKLFQKLVSFLRTALGIKALEKKLDWAQAVNPVQQKLLSLQYQDLLHRGRPLPKLEDTEFRSFSQNGEDGILLYIFSLIGAANKRCVEICAGNGIVCNSANLIVNHGWTGLLFDGDEDNVGMGREFYARLGITSLWPPKFVHAWITAENVNQVIGENGFEGEIDLLTVDLDGMDWWIWKAIEVVNPRVVVVEYQDAWGPDSSVTVPYDPDFVASFDQNGSPNYCGASLRAFVKLGNDKGYRLIGCQAFGFNAFFLRNDLGTDIFPEIAPSECFKHPRNVWRMRTKLPLVESLEWVAV